MNRTTMALGTLAVALGGTGCAPTVIDPIHQEQQQGPGAGGTAMLAMLAKDVPQAPPDPSNPATVFFPPASDPDTLMLAFSNAALTCGAPAITCNGDNVWETIFAVPPDLVRLGPIDLGNPLVTMTSWMFLGDGSMCGGGGGGGGIGVPAEPGKTLTITGTDLSSISVQLSGGVTGGLGDGMNDAPVIDGSYTAARCEPAPPTPPASAAVAILGSKLPSGLPANPTIGATPDPTALYVFLGTGTQACADPLSDLGCSGAGRVVLKIPASLQQPGTIALSDPQVAASFAVAMSGGPSCPAPVAGSFMAGTLTITSSDASGLVLTLYGSAVSGAPVPGYDADGLYQATICP